MKEREKKNKTHIEDDLDLYPTRTRAHLWTSQSVQHLLLMPLLQLHQLLLVLHVHGRHHVPLVGQHLP